MATASLVIKGKKLTFQAELSPGYPTKLPTDRVYDVEGVKLLVDKAGNVKTEGFDKGSKIRD
jgi:hypothetical protein